MTKNVPALLAVALEGMMRAGCLVGRAGRMDLVIYNPGRKDVTRLARDGLMSRSDTSGVRAVKFMDTDENGAPVQRIMMWPGNGWYHRDFRYEVVEAYGERKIFAEGEFNFDQELPMRGFSKSKMDEIMKWVDAPWVGPTKTDDPAAPNYTTLIL